jgi:hypothetical protein
MNPSHYAHYANQDHHDQAPACHPHPKQRMINDHPPATMLELLHPPPTGLHGQNDILSD